MNTKSLILVLSLLGMSAHADPSIPIHQATAQDPDQSVPEVSTDELRQILASGSATVFDARPYKEYAISHIPGVEHVGGKPGSNSAQYTSDANAIAATVGEDKAAPIVVYCSGPYCGRSKRAAKDLMAIGYTNVRRYQLGMPVWRALGGVTQIEPEGLRYVYGKDQTAVWLDTREPEDFQAETLAGAHSLPCSSALGGDELSKASKDGRLPVEDHNTRIIVFGGNGTEARSVAEALTMRKSYHNVAFFDGSFEQLRAELK